MYVIDHIYVKYTTTLMHPINTKALKNGLFTEAKLTNIILITICYVHFNLSHCFLLLCKIS
jgi:hypothetical protein